MTDYVQVVTSIDSREAAEALATSVLERRLAACVQISPCRSRYHWQGNIEQAEEYLCVMKSRADLYPELEEAIRSLHPYEVPEILATRIMAGHVPYLAWLDRELRPGREEA